MCPRPDVAHRPSVVLLSCFMFVVLKKELLSVDSSRLCEIQAVWPRWAVEALLLVCRLTLKKLD